MHVQNKPCCMYLMVLTGVHEFCLAGRMIACMGIFFFLLIDDIS